MHFITKYPIAPRTGGRHKNFRELDYITFNLNFGGLFLYLATKNLGARGALALAPLDSTGPAKLPIQTISCLPFGKSVWNSQLFCILHRQHVSFFCMILTSNPIFCLFFPIFWIFSIHKYFHYDCTINYVFILEALSHKYIFCKLCPTIFEFSFDDFSPKNENSTNILI